MSQRREYVHVELNNEKYLCCIWYGSKELLWYGGPMDISGPVKLYYAITREGLLKKIEMGISSEMNK